MDKCVGENDVEYLFGIGLSAFVGDGKDGPGKMR